MPASSARDKVAEAVSQWVEAAAQTDWVADAKPERKLIVVGLEAIGNVRALWEPCAEYDSVLETLGIMCCELSARLSTSTASAFSETVNDLVAKWIGTDRQVEGRPFPLSHRIDGCARFSCTTSSDHVQLLVSALVERDVDDFVYDATELVMRIANASAASGEGDPDSDDSDDSDDSEEGEESEGSEDSGFESDEGSEEAEEEEEEESEEECGDGEPSGEEEYEEEGDGEEQDTSPQASKRDRDSEHGAGDDDEDEDLKAIFRSRKRSK
jgi:hypothetical protein